MEIHNTPHLNDEHVFGLREISERRAATISNMVDAAKKRGLDDDFAFEAVAAYGTDNGIDMRKSMADPDSFTEFADDFGTDHNREIYEMERVKQTDDELVIDFHYCPYVAAWLKQGRPVEEMPRLCDIAMAGDHALADEFPQVQFELEGTIAQGNSVCRLHFRRTGTEQPQESVSGSVDAAPTAGADSVTDPQGAGEEPA
ncbi:L-2-amino-thiazoline-4-carboxylic acid hydrolase [Acidipropionibacterium jensenii]|uniref:L-2-amino-thiazoline-4-carboxylic acid hydrolase n=1 Tax=Acidipropionibacterium jensenii TaxID=1749 RepID=UPI00214C0B64|nr:L-2-amino-thiazoline-4-carboxylic acid hydrolase [Acidipropionibacterium jensenii]